MDASNSSSTRNRRLQFLTGLLGLGIGVSSTLLLIYFSRVAAGKVEILASAEFQTAGVLTPDSSTEITEAAKKTASAKALAEKVLEMITEKDGDAIAPLCSLPFLGGAPHSLRIVTNQDELLKALNADLCKSLCYGPFLFEKEWDASQVLESAAFLEQFRDSLSNQSGLRKIIQQLHLTTSDRVVVESHRGMLLFVRVTSDEARLIGIVPIGFRSVEREYKLTRDVIYGRKYGTSLTLDVLQPLKNSNGGALLELNNGSFVSPPRHYAGILNQTQTLLNAGYTVIYVTPSGTPKHSIPEILADTQRAVRFVRYHAKRLNLEPDCLAVMGISSGGYLAHMVGVWTDPAPKFPPEPDPTSDLAETDPVEAVSSRVQVVISYAGPSDWLNYGRIGKTIFEHELPAAQTHQGIFDLFEFDSGHFGFKKLEDRRQQLQELKKLSPINLVSPSAAPTLIFHGDQDENVPVEQAERMYAALTNAGVDAELVVKRGEGHGWNWADHPEDSAKIVDWLNRHFKAKPRL